MFWQCCCCSYWNPLFCSCTLSKEGSNCNSSLDKAKDLSQEWLEIVSISNCKRYTLNWEFFAAGLALKMETCYFWSRVKLAHSFLKLEEEFYEWTGEYKDHCCVSSVVRMKQNSQFFWIKNIIIITRGQKCSIITNSLVFIVIIMGGSIFNCVVSSDIH